MNSALLSFLLHQLQRVDSNSLYSLVVHHSYQNEYSLGHDLAENLLLPVPDWYEQMYYHWLQECLVQH